VNIVRLYAAGSLTDNPFGPPVFFARQTAPMPWPLFCGVAVLCAAVFLFVGGFL